MGSHEANHDHALCVESAIAKAELICEEKGARFTALRRTILKFVWAEHKAVKAYDLLDKLAKTETGSAKPPTVYRALDFLIEQGLVHKIQSLNAYVGCPYPGEKHLSQFLICDRCEAITEINVSNISKWFLSKADEIGFDVHSQTVELHGHCRQCL